MRTSFLSTFVALLLLTSTNVQASAFDTEELTYEDLVNELSQKRDQSQTKREVQSKVRSHLGLGIVNTWTQISSRNGNYSPSLNGFELSTGTDLNSEKVRGEISFRNFFDKATATQTAGLREIGGNFQYRNELDSVWRSRFMGGLALRHLRFEDPGARVSIDDTSSMVMAGAGLEARLSKEVSIGGDLSTRLPLGTPTSDRSSIDVGLKLDTTF